MTQFVFDKLIIFAVLPSCIDSRGMKKKNATVEKRVNIRPTYFM